MDMESFNPHDKKYKKVEDLPREEQPKYIDLPDTGFVLKEALAEAQSAQREAEEYNSQRSLIQKILGKDKLTEDVVLHERGLDENEVQEILTSLEQIDIQKETITNLKPEEVVELNIRLHELHFKLGQFKNEREEVIFFNNELSPLEPKTEVNEEAIFSYVSKLSEQARDYFKKLYEAVILETIVSEKFKEYAKSNWRQTMQEELAKAETPFGSARDFVINFYKNNGINIENPEAKDVEAFFKMKEYLGGEIKFEARRRIKDETHLTAQEQHDLLLLSTWLFYGPDGNSWGLLHGKPLRDKVESLIQKMAAL